MVYATTMNRPQTYVYLSSLSRSLRPFQVYHSTQLSLSDSRQISQTTTGCRCHRYSSCTRCCMPKSSEVCLDGDKHKTLTASNSGLPPTGNKLRKTSLYAASLWLFSGSLKKTAHLWPGIKSFLILPKFCSAVEQCRNYSSSLFVSRRSGQPSAGFEFDDDLEERLKDVDLLKKNVELRGMKMDVEQIVNDYGQYMLLKREKEELETQREEIASRIAELVKEQKQGKVKTNVDGVKMQLLSEEGKAKKLALKELQPEFWNIEEKVMLAALSLPNHLAPTVPEVYKVIDEYYSDKKLTEPVDHIEVLKESKMVRLSNVGNKAYYLRGRLAELEQELIQHFCWQLRSKGITQMLAPEMFKTPVVEACGLDVMDTSVIYRLLHKQEIKMLSSWDFDHLFLRGAGPLSFLSYFAKSLIRREDLPQRMFVVGRFYQPETAETKDLPGLLGALQTYKISMCGIADTPERSKELWEEFVSILYSIYRIYELPYRMVAAPAWALSPMEQKRTEFRMWVPSQQDYLDIASISDCGDYSSRRMMIRCSDSSKPADSRSVHMVHCEVVDVTRMIALLLEHKQISKYWLIGDPLDNAPTDDLLEGSDSAPLVDDIADSFS